VTSKPEPSQSGSQQVSRGTTKPPVDTTVPQVAEEFPREPVNGVPHFFSPVHPSSLERPAKKKANGGVKKKANGGVNRSV